MFVNMLPIRHETYQSNGKTYGIQAFVEVETLYHRVFVFEGKEPLLVQYGASGGVADGMVYAKMDVIEELVKAAKQDIDTANNGILGIRSWTK